MKINRRDFLKTTALTSLYFAGFGAPNPAKYNDVKAVVFKKSLLFILMLLKTPDD